MQNVKTPTLKSEESGTRKTCATEPFMLSPNNRLRGS
jgi:hypothetical protein